MILSTLIVVISLHVKQINGSYQHVYFSVYLFVDFFYHKVKSVKCLLPVNGHTC